MPLEKKPTFRRGNITTQFKEEERVYLLSLFKKAKPKTDIEKRIVKRAILKLLGQRTYHYPLYPDKECPVCEQEVRGDIFDAHVLRCKLKEKKLKSIPKIDPDVLAMVEAGL